MATTNRNASLVTKEPTPSTVVPMVSGGPSSTRPANPPLGYLYYDTSLGYEVAWDGTIWKALVPVVNPSVGFGPETSKPTNPTPGYLYFNSTTQQLNAYNSSAWVIVGPFAASSTGGGGTGDGGTVILASPPTILAHPQGQSVSVGQVATFSITATSTTTLSFQWQKNGVLISGANSSSYLTPATTLGDSASTYRCIVTNNAGSVTSLPAMLTVSGSAVAPVVTQNPDSATISVGNTTFFMVFATGSTPLFYQWRKNGTNIVGADSYTYITPVAALTDNGAGFDCFITNSIGSATSSQAILTVTAATVVPAGLSFTSFTTQGVTSERAVLIDGFVCNSCDAASSVIASASCLSGVFPAGVWVTAVDAAGVVVGTKTADGGESVLGVEFSVSNGGYTFLVSKLGEPLAVQTRCAVTAGSVLFQNASIRADVYSASQYPPAGFAMEITLPSTSGTAATAVLFDGTGNTVLSGPNYYWNLNGDVANNPVSIVPGGQIGCTASTAVGGNVRLQVYAS